MMRKVKTKLIILALVLSGCCHCPPTDRIGDPVGDVDSLDSVMWANMSDSVWNPIRYMDSVSILDMTPINIQPTIVYESYGPWPCRWIYLERYEYRTVVSKPSYTVDGDVGWWNPPTAYDDAYVIKDSVWHCDGDGVFTR